MSFLRRKYYGDGNHVPSLPLILNTNSEHGRSIINWWPVFDTAAASAVVRDLGPRNIPLSNIATIALTTTRFGGGQWASLAGGADQVIAVADQTPFLSLPSGGLALEMWIKLNAATAGPVLFSLREDAATWEAWYMDIAAGPVFRAISADGSVFSVAVGPSAIPPVDGDIFHVVASFPSTTSRTMYVNGVPGTENTATSAPSLTTGTTVIGGYRNSAWLGEATIDVLYAAIHSPAPSAAQVRQWYAPETRWDLYLQPKTMVMASEFVAAPAAISFPPRGPSITHLLAR